MTALRVKLLTEENAMSSRFQIRIFGPHQSIDLPGKNPWSKWSALGIDEHGDTINIHKRFFGDATPRARAIQLLHSKLTDGVIVDVNTQCARGKGCKATTRDARYDSGTSRVSLEITEKTEYKILPSGHPLQKKIPARPKVMISLAEFTKFQDSRRVNLCGVIQSVHDPKNVLVKASGQKAEKDERVVEVKIIDDTLTGVTLSVWAEQCEQFKDKEGLFAAIYNANYKSTEKAKTLQTTNETVVRFITTADGIQAREDAMITKAKELQGASATQSATVYSGSGSKQHVQGSLRLVCVNTLVLASEIRTDLPEKGFHLEGVVCKLADRDNLVVDGRLWAKLTLVDASQQINLYATEDALLSLSGLRNKEDFLKAVEDSSLFLPRAALRVSRTITACM